MKIFLGLALLIFASIVHAEWLSICPQVQLPLEKDYSEGYLAHIVTSQEHVKVLRLTRKPMQEVGCYQKKLSISRESVAWGGFALGMTDHIQTVALQGVWRVNMFNVSEIILKKGSSPEALSINSPPQENISSDNISKSQRSAWFWSSKVWLETPERIFAAQKNYELKRIYITVPVSNNDVVNVEELKHFLKSAHIKKLQVWAVFGDPRAIFDSESVRFTSMAAAYAIFNEGNQDTERLDGLQLDIEPYLIPGYLYAKSEMMEKYANIVNAVRQNSPHLALDIVLPFWFDINAMLELANLDNIENSITSITVMDYRTEPDQIKYFAKKFLAWGEIHHKIINIALESGIMPKEENNQYQLADTGELNEFDMAGIRTMLLLKQPIKKTASVESVFKLIHSQSVDGTSVSFYGHRDMLMQLVPMLEKEFSLWGSFNGMSLHGLD